MKLVKETDSQDTKKVSDQEAEEAFRTILTWMGEDPSKRRIVRNSKKSNKSI
jgi:GTP cyclohydrolase I